MSIYLIISLSVFGLFLAFFWLKYGIQRSISATYRLLLLHFSKAAHSIWVALFFMLAIAILSTGQSAWYFFSAVGLLGVGAFPQYWEKAEVRKHVTAAYIAYAFPIVKLALFTPGLTAPLLATAWIVFIGLLSINALKIPYRTTIIELSGFIVIIVGFSL